MQQHNPTRSELLAATGGTVVDVIAPGLVVLFCGINPGLYSAAVGHHFARPGNRFWRALHRSGFTNELLHPSEECELLRFKLGVTNIAARATASAGELTKKELEQGGRKLAAKVARISPKVLAVLGIGAYRLAFHQPKAAFGLQELQLGETAVWVLPNPSGLNAYYQLKDLVKHLSGLRKIVYHKRAS